MNTLIIISGAAVILAVGWLIATWLGRGLEELDSIAEDSDGEWLS